MEPFDSVSAGIRKTIIECGKLVLDANRDNLNIQNKEGNNNYVTEYDILIQNKLKKELLELLPEAGFLGEENDVHKNIDNEYVFVVDPIDGTANFSRDLKLSIISVALLKNGVPYLGFCYNPYVDELYEAKSGHGAFLNGNKIHVSKRNLKNGIVFCGSSPYYDDLRKKSLEIQRIYASIASDFRRFGSAAIEICNVASGKAELYYELKLMPWDYAAAALILKEAGGIIKTVAGDEIQYFNPSSILASNNVEDYFKYIK